MAQLSKSAVTWLEQICQTMGVFFLTDMTKSAVAHWANLQWHICTNLPNKGEYFFWQIWANLQWHIWENLPSRGYFCREIWANCQWHIWANLQWQIWANLPNKGSISSNRFEQICSGTFEQICSDRFEEISQTRGYFSRQIWVHSCEWKHVYLQTKCFVLRIIQLFECITNKMRNIQELIKVMGVTEHAITM